MTARYVPAEHGGVGGDWYDVFILPSGWLCVVMGDVVGRGLGAAAMMGRLRSALRAHALHGSDPAEVLNRLDQ
ncbi:MAG: SpoIIE family protein phosphatase [Pseudonocardiales bacterium]|nr:SpoIIE family protein phosphatase [Pseudonocardiales bacterium]